MRTLYMPFTPRLLPYTVALAATVLLVALAWREPSLLPYLAVFIAAFAGLALLGTVDLLQSFRARVRSGCAYAGDFEGGAKTRADARI